MRCREITDCNKRFMGNDFWQNEISVSANCYSAMIEDFDVNVLLIEYCRNKER